MGPTFELADKTSPWNAMVRPAHAYGFQGHLKSFHDNTSKEAKDFIKFFYTAEHFGESQEDGTFKEPTLSPDEVIQQCLDHPWLKGVDDSTVPAEWAKVKS